jgi:hypothetical protein
MFHLLPPELRVLIYNYCELSTLKSLRSSCRMFERETNSILFHTVSLDILPQSISTLRMIANRSSLACHVQKLVVSTNLLRPCSFSTFKRQLCHEEHISLSQLDLLPYSRWILSISHRSKVRRRYKRYCHYLNRQKEILRDRASLQLTLIKLFRVKKVELRLLFDAEQSRFWQTFDHEIFASSNDGDFNFRFTTTATLYNDTNLCVTHSLLDEMSDRLTSLEIDFIPCTFWQFEHYTGVWSHLRHLKICAEHGSTLEETCSVKAGLRKILLNIGLIEFLHLEITPTCGYLSRTDFGELFADVQLTVLQYLKICTGKISLHDLLRVFKVYKSKLQLFYITDLHLVDGRWETVLSLLKGCLHNSVVSFEGITDGDGWSIRAVVPFNRVLKVKQAAIHDRPS